MFTAEQTDMFTVGRTKKLKEGRTDMLTARRSEDFQTGGRIYLRWDGQMGFKQTEGRHFYSRINKISQSDEQIRRVYDMKDGRPSGIEYDWVKVLEPEAAPGFHERGAKVFGVINGLVTSY